MINLPVNPRAMRFLYVVLGLTNTVILALFALVQAGLLRPGLTEVRELDPAIQFDLTSEGGIACVWYSSALFLLLAVAALLAFWADDASPLARTRKWRSLRFGWLLLAAIGLFLSFDESAQFHEGIGFLVGLEGWLKIPGLTDYSPQFIWVVLFTPLMLLSAGFLVAFFLYWLRTVARARLLGSLGIVLWATVPILEFAESRLVRTFGEHGASAEQFVEESVEVLGATLMLMAALEYIIARASPAEAKREPRVQPAGRRAAMVGAAGPLLLIPLATLAAFVNVDVHDSLANAGYGYAASRIAHVMVNTDLWGHHMVMSNACNAEALATSFPHAVRTAGALVAYPPAAKRGTSPERTLTFLTLAGDETPEALAAGMARVAMLSSHLWVLQCGSSSSADREVDAWLSARYGEAERYTLPGLPPLVLIHVVPPKPLRLVEGEVAPGGVAYVFGDDEVSLRDYSWSVDEDSPRVLRLRLFWEALKPLEADYHVFVHLVHAKEGNLLTQSDGVPMYDRYPFSQFKTGEVVVDAYDVPVPDDISLRDVEIRLGLYDYQSQQRLRVGEADSVVVQLE